MNRRQHGTIVHWANRRLQAKLISATPQQSWLPPVMIKHTQHAVRLTIWTGEYKCSYAIGRKIVWLIYSNIYGFLKTHFVFSVWSMFIFGRAAKSFSTQKRSWWWDILLFMFLNYHKVRIIGLILQWWQYMKAFCWQVKTHLVHVEDDKLTWAAAQHTQIY